MGFAWVMDPTLFVGTIDFTMGELQMAKGDLAGVAAVPSITSNKNLPVLSGGTLCPATLFDGDTHFGIAVAVEADGKESYLMIPDATRIDKGQPVYITKPVTIKGEHLATYLKSKGVTLPKSPNIEAFLNTASVTCDAFFFSKSERGLTDEEVTNWDRDNPNVTKPANDKIDEGAFLMMFNVKTEGLLSTLVDPDLGKLFDITGASLRVLRCRASSKKILEEYAELLGDK